MDDRAGQDRKRRKTRDRAMIVLLIGIVLLMPPVAGIFELETRILGLPATLLYLFVVWACLIASTAALSRTLQSGEDRNGSDQ